MEGQDCQSLCLRLERNHLLLIVVQPCNCNPWIAYSLHTFPSREIKTWETMQKSHRGLKHGVRWGRPILAPNSILMFAPIQLLGCEIHSQELWVPWGCKNLGESNFYMENSLREAQKMPNRYYHISRSQGNLSEFFFVHYWGCGRHFSGGDAQITQKGIIAPYAVLSHSL